jgi:Na+/H+ antiporter NhaD/arsenite permease-like protein
MEWPLAAAASVFAVTFLLLALGRLGRLPIPRGASALAGGAATWLLLAPSGHVEAQAWRLVEWQVIALLAGLMALAGLCEAAGLFAGVRRLLARLSPAMALWTALLLVAATSAILLNDAAVVVLVPFLLPAMLAHGLPAIPAVTLMAVAANVGSLLTPFGNPQNAVLADVGGLGVLDFLRDQGPLVALGAVLLGLASWTLARRPAAGAPPPQPAPIEPNGRLWALAGIAVFLAGAIAGPPWMGLGGAAILGAAVAYAGLAARLGNAASRAAVRAIDLNVLALFVGLYLLTAGLPAWFPADRLPLAALDDPASAAAVTTVLSNVVGNVPAILTFATLDEAWVRAHAAFLVTVSTLGGALLLTGSAASLLAADQARKLGVEVRFLPFLRDAVPWTLPLLVAGAALNWKA